MQQKANYLPLGEPGGSIVTSSAWVSRPKFGQIRIASNPWLENATLNALMENKGFLKSYGVDAEIVLTEGVAGPFDAIASGEADICMVSGYSHAFPRISVGAPLKVVGAAMRKSAMAIFAKSESDRIGTLADLKGRKVAVGPPNGLLHMLMLQVLRDACQDVHAVEFVHLGSNEKCYRAVVVGKADACCASISYLNNSDGMAIVEGGQIWQALPRYIFQTAYASAAALNNKFDGLVGTMAAYGALYTYLMKPETQDDYLSARRRVSPIFDEPSALAIWNFIQSQRPYRADLTISDGDMDYLQSIFHGIGIMRQWHKAGELMDMSAARKAAGLVQSLE